jgi:hypothetical protein
MQEKTIIEKKRELVLLAKQTGNMPTLLYAFNKMIEFCMKDKEKFKWTNKEELINIMHKAMTGTLSYPQQQPVDNFIHVMNNWKEYKQNHVTN